MEQSWSPRYNSRLKVMIPKNWAEKPPPLFCLFVRDQARVTQVEYPRSPYSDSSYPNIFYRLPTLSGFQILTYTEQDHGAYGKPIESPITIQTNIPAIIVTLLATELWSVISSSLAKGDLSHAPNYFLLHSFFNLPAWLSQQQTKVPMGFWTITTK